MISSTIVSCNKLSCALTLFVFLNINLTLLSQQRIYTSPLASGVGSSIDPSSLASAFASASSGDTIIADTGTYTLNNPLQIPSGVYFQGGYVQANGWTNSNIIGSTKILRDTSNPEGVVGSDRLVALYGNSATNFEFDNVNISTLDANGNSRTTYGVHLTSCSDYSFSRTIVVAGKGSNGVSGLAGVDGSIGGSGFNGGPGDNDDDDNAGLGGNGGNGGGTGAGLGGPGGQNIFGSTIGQIGSNGTTSTVIRAGGGGGGGASGGEEDRDGGRGGNGGGVLSAFGANTSYGLGGDSDGCGDGDPGGIGGNGTSGADGINGTDGVIGTFLSGFFNPGSSGSDGTDGVGGQGGAGGGGGAGHGGTFCTDGSGSGGGGGGGGGEGGEGGKGGSSGGGSFGVYLYNNGANGEFINCLVQSSSAGTGGIGGSGGTGGLGGVRGNGNNYTGGDVGSGGNGGIGGNGGDGGNGGNGVDGISENLKLDGGAPLSIFSIAACINTQAAFSLNPVNGNSIPHTVFFTDMSTLPDTWLWDFGDASTSTLQNPVHNYTSFGNFSVRLIVSDTILGCYDTAYASVSVCNLVANISASSNVTCNGLANGTALASASAGSSPYTYLWSNAATTASISGLVASSYYVTITDANGCTDSSSVTISEPTALNTTISLNNNLSCFGANDGSLTANISGGTSPYTYLWSNLAATTSATASSLAAGGYTVTITDANGCIDSASSFVTSPIALSLNATSTNVSCNGGNDGTANVGAAGGVTPYTYLWSNAATTASTSGLIATTYSVTITDNNGCSSSTSVSISEPPLLSATIGGITNVSCNGGTDGTAAIIANGGIGPYSYSWSNSSSTSATASGLSATAFAVTVTDNNACTATINGSINEPTMLSASISATTNVNCYGGSDGTATATASGGSTPYTFNWSNSNTNATATALSATSYTVTITDANGCTAATTAAISEPTQLSVSINIDSLPSAYGASDGGVTAIVSGGAPSYTYSWSSTPTATPSIAGLSAGTYTVTVTDYNNCTSTSSFILSEPALLLCTVNTTSTSCSPGNDGSATVNASGGVTPYTYLWSNLDNTATTTNLLPGTYTVTVTDNNGVSTTCSATVNSPAPINGNGVITDVSCNGLTDGSISVATTGGTSPYTYYWNTTASSPAISNLAATSYTVTITDANACSIVESFVVNVGDNIPPTAIAQNLTVYLDFNGMATITSNDINNGSTDNCTISSVSIDSSNFNCSEIGSNTVKLLVIDNNGNRDSTTSTVTVLDTIRPVALASNSNVYLDANGQASVLASSVDNGSIDNCSIASLELDSTTFDCSELGSNQILFTATDVHGNKDSINIVLTVLDTVKPSPISQALTVYLDANKEANITANQIDNGSFDACQLDSVSISKSQFNCNEVGNNTIQLIAYDNSGNIDSTTAVVTVLDTIGASRDTIVVTACGSYTWMQNNNTYAISGFYRDTTFNAIGCDSIYHHLDLTIIDVLTSIDTVEACDSLLWMDGITYFTNNNTAVDTLLSSLGCDSVVTLNLTIFNSNGSNQSASSCDSYTWSQNGMTYTSSGLYTDTLSNANGCDSVISLDLTVLPLDVNVVNTGDSIFAVQTGVSYQWIDCDNNNSVITGATSRGYKPDTTGHFAVIVNNGLCFDTSNCNLVRFVGINSLSYQNENFNIYPIPSNDFLFIQTDVFSEDRTIRIFSLNGRLIFEKQALEKLERIELEGWDAGVYLVYYQNKMKKVIVTK